MWGDIERLDKIQGTVSSLYKSDLALISNPGREFPCAPSTLVVLKSKLTKPSSLLPSNALSGSPRGPSNSFKGFEIPVTEHKEVMNIHLGAWPRCSRCSRQLGPAERTRSCKQGNSSHFVCWAVRTSSLAPARDRALCLCGRSWAKPSGLS